MKYIYNIYAELSVTIHTITHKENLFGFRLSLELETHLIKGLHVQR
jgi:hypothetical protein